jgi:hypothetical protein
MRCTQRRCPCSQHHIFCHMSCCQGQRPSAVDMGHKMTPKFALHLAKMCFRDRTYKRLCRSYLCTIQQRKACIRYRLRQYSPLRTCSWSAVCSLALNTYFRGTDCTSTRVSRLSLSSTSLESIASTVTIRSRPCTSPRYTPCMPHHLARCIPCCRYNRLARCCRPQKRCEKDSHCTSTRISRRSLPSTCPQDTVSTTLSHSRPCMSPQCTLHMLRRQTLCIPCCRYSWSASSCRRVSTCAWGTRCTSIRRSLPRMCYICLQDTVSTTLSR